MTNKPTDDSIPLSAESFQHEQEIADNPDESTQALIDLLSEDDNVSTEVFKSRLKRNLKRTIKIDCTEDKDLHLYAELFSLVHSVLSVELRYLGERGTYNLTHSVAKHIVYSWLPKDQLDHFKDNAPSCSNLEPGQALYADYIAVNAVHSDVIDSLVPWSKLTQDQQLIWTRTALAYLRK